MLAKLYENNGLLPKKHYFIVITINRPFRRNGDTERAMAKKQFFHSDHKKSSF